MEPIIPENIDNSEEAIEIHEEQIEDPVSSKIQSDNSQLMETFKMFDFDGSGTITPIKLKLAMKSIGLDPSNEEIIRMISKVDKTRKGYVTFDEFSEMIQGTSQKLDTKDEVQHAFQLMDLDKTGKISFKSLKKVVTELGEDIQDD